MEKVSKDVSHCIIHGKWYSRLEYMALRTKTWLCEAVRDAAAVQVSNWTLNEWDPQEQCKVGGAGKGENLWTEHRGLGADQAPSIMI